MRLLRKASLAARAMAAALTLWGTTGKSQEVPADARPPVVSVDRIPQDARTNGLPQQAADGSRSRTLPIEAYAVAPGTRVLIRLEDELDTGETKQGKLFRARTLEPMEAGSGIYLPRGAEIRGHVSRVEPAGVAGRAKIWLVFDEIRTKFGPLPIVADVVSVPGDHSVRTGGPEKEGVIEGKTSTQRAAAEAAGEGAGMGALHGIKHKNAKEAVEGAATAALAAYLMEAGRGHELQLPKGAKLEIELERALYLVRE